MASDTVRDVLEGVLLLMGQEDTSWANMKAFLGKRSVKEDIINYDAHRYAQSLCVVCRTVIVMQAVLQCRQCEKLNIVAAAQALIASFWRTPCTTT